MCRILSKMQIPRTKLVKVVWIVVYGYLIEPEFRQYGRFNELQWETGNLRLLTVNECSTWNIIYRTRLFHVEQMHHFAALRFCSVLVYIHQDGLS